MDRLFDRLNALADEGITTEFRFYENGILRIRVINTEKMQASCQYINYNDLRHSVSSSYVIISEMIDRGLAELRKSESRS